MKTIRILALLLLALAMASLFGCAMTDENEAAPTVKPVMPQSTAIPQPTNTASAGEGLLATEMPSSEATAPAQTNGNADTEGVS